MMDSPMRRRVGSRLAIVAAMAATLPAVVFANDGEAKMYTVTNWVDCSGAARPAWDDMTWRWYTTLGDGPSYFQDGSWTDGNLTANVLCDLSGDLTNCKDHVNIDDADAAMIGLHGADSGNHWSGSMRRMTAGGDCTIDAPEGITGDQLFLGFDLDILHLSSCQSMDDDNLPFAWRMMSNPGVPGKVRVVTGFHGFMWISTGYVDDYEDMAEDGHDVSIKAAWLDTMYDYWVGPNDDDMCPVAYAIGSSLADCQSRLNSVRYGKEGSATPTVSNYCFSAIAGCDPAGETTFTKP